MSLTKSPTDFRCDICGRSVTSERMNGIRKGDDGLVLKPPISTDVHICNLCFAGIARLYQSKMKEKL